MLPEQLQDEDLYAHLRAAKATRAAEQVHRRQSREVMSVPPEEELIDLEGLEPTEQTHDRLCAISASVNARDKAFAQIGTAL